jgi:hypothetical protein
MILAKYVYINVRHNLFIKKKHYLFDAVKLSLTPSNAAFRAKLTRFSVQDDNVEVPFVVLPLVSVDVFVEPFPFDDDNVDDGEDDTPDVVVAGVTNCIFVLPDFNFSRAISYANAAFSRVSNTPIYRDLPAKYN